MFDLDRLSMMRPARLGYSADPAIDVLLDKSKIAEIRIKQLEQVVASLNQEIALAQLETKLLREQYSIKG
jgi:hypothetical protein